MAHLEIVLLFFLVAAIYASVGFGGGSSYLAILALYDLPFKEIRLVALLCNIIVVSSGVIIFIIHKQVDWKKILPLVLVSVPMAFLGARIKLSEHIFFILLGVTLIIAAILLWIRASSRVKDEVNKRTRVAINGLLGGSIGFLSGMVGIGGGIFLSPLLNLLQWDTAKKIAAAASVFILVNSVAGIFGQVLSFPENIQWREILILIASVFAGGQIGSRLLANTFDPLIIRRVTSVLVFIAGIEVLVKHV